MDQYNPNPAPQLPPQPLPVRVTDVDMSFGQMVWFMVKWVLASIPAFLFLAIIFGFIGLAFSVLMAACGVAAAGAH